MASPGRSSTDKSPFKQKASGGKTYFTRKLFDFLRELAAHNDRDWFQRNKHRYLSDVRDPMLAFITDFAPHLHEISPHYLANPRPNGGSLFRIYRDIRFSKDKSPYKLNAGAHFRHESHKDAHAPGFYLHLKADNIFMASGVWRPDSKSLALIREAIVESPDAWRSIVSAKALRQVGGLVGDSLLRPPRGYAADHPLITDLKRKDFFARAKFTKSRCLQARFDAGL